MGTMRAALTPADQSYIAAQPVFFVATAAAAGRVNVSPKGGTSLCVLAPDRVAWLNLTGRNRTSIDGLPTDIGSP